jgi:hypothetical protein
MKFARWCELQGHEYQYVRGIVYPKINPDEILMSCIFSYHSNCMRKPSIIIYGFSLMPRSLSVVYFPSLNPEWFKNGMVLYCPQGLMC